MTIDLELPEGWSIEWGRVMRADGAEGPSIGLLIAPDGEIECMRDTERECIAEACRRTQEVLGS